MRKIEAVAKKRSFAEAAEAAKEEHRALSPVERVLLVEELRRIFFAERLGPVLPVVKKRPWKNPGGG